VPGPPADAHHHFREAYCAAGDAGCAAREDALEAAAVADPAALWEGRKDGDTSTGAGAGVFDGLEPPGHERAHYYFKLANVRVDVDDFAALLRRAARLLGRGGGGGGGGEVLGSVLTARPDRLSA